jgi:hypothetical protein
MIAAMAAAVSAASTLRLVVGLSGKSALAVGVGPLGAGTGAGAAENGPLKATGFTVGMVATAADGLLTGVSLRPTEYATAAVIPNRINIVPPLIVTLNRKPRNRASCAKAVLQA